jgi:hypothetical protein
MPPTLRKTDHNIDRRRVICEDALSKATFSLAFASSGHLVN